MNNSKLTPSMKEPLVGKHSLIDFIKEMNKKLND